jgi:hypothetical protein
MGSTPRQRAARYFAVDGTPHQKQSRNIALLMILAGVGAAIVQATSISWKLMVVVPLVITFYVTLGALIRFWWQRRAVREN